MDFFLEWIEDPAILVVLIVLPPVLLYALGAWLGVQKKIVVYRNYYDVVFVGLLVIIPLILLSIAAVFQEQAGLIFELGLPTVLTLEGIVLLFILVGTWRDNRGLFSTLMALYVKLPTGILFLVQVSAAFTGNTRQQRRQSLLWSLLLLPLLYALVHDKQTGRLPGIPRGSTL